MTKTEYLELKIVEFEIELSYRKRYSMNHQQHIEVDVLDHKIKGLKHLIKVINEITP